MLARLGVCSWSLQPASPADLAAKVRAAGLRHVQLALDPIRRGDWPLDDTLRHLREAGISIVSGMMAFEGEDYSTLDSIRETGGVRLDHHWPANLAAAEANAALARRLGLSLVTFHAGFLPHDPRDPIRAVMLDRIRRLADVFAAQGVAVALETGQETADTLVQVLRDLDHPNVGVNFDPANMILYGMGDPQGALGFLLPYVRQVHIKDARASAVSGRWGTEVPVGQGQVDWDEFFAILHDASLSVDMLIEREAGSSRVADVITARSMAETHAWSASFSHLRARPRPQRRQVRVAVVGLGFMGATHIRAYRAAHEAGFPCRLVAVADTHADRLTGRANAAGNIGPRADGPLFDPTSVRAYEDPLRLIHNADADLVSICTHTDTHVSLALAALRAGMHVLVEKPVALDARDIESLASAAATARRLCMPAMCMRFWPGWTWLRDRIADGSFGSVRSAVFRRLGTQPAWSREFYADPSRCGGALMDLHIHDADFLAWCFGKFPQVASTGSIDHLTTLYRSHLCPHIVAEAGWDHSPGWTFRMQYTVIFDDATADFDISRDAPLVLYRGGRADVIPLPPESGYDGEIRHVLDCIQQERDSTLVTLDDAVAVARLLDAERRALESSRPVPLA